MNYFYISLISIASRLDECQTRNQVVQLHISDVEVEK